MPKPNMNSPTKGMFRRVSWPRLVTVTVLAPGAALLLFSMVAAQGDPDLPPYIPATLAERLCSTVAAVVVWPAVAAGRCWRDGDHTPVVWALFLLSGLFWASLVELLFIAKNARKA